jgi:hypothetical protein
MVRAGYDAAMRRALVAALILAPSLAGADRWVVTGEAGGEVDTNVQRIETGPGISTPPVESAVLRFGLRAEGRGPAQGGTYVASLSNLTRVVSDSTVSVEDVTLLAGDLRWTHPLGERPVAAGVGVIAADALPLADTIGARTFSNIGADALLAARDGDNKRMLLAVGGRSFEYKPDHTFDWSGPTASLRIDYVPWQSPGGARSLELALTAGVEARAYNSPAFAGACAPGSPPDPSCSSPTPTIERRDRFQRVGIDATWIGKQVFSAGYQLVVIDSNSYGQSLARHRATASVTSALPGDTFITVLGILQIDRYLDGLVVGDVNQHDFVNIEDENRSSLQVRLGKKLSPEWSLEARAAIWRNLSSSAMDLSFARELVYGGVVYSK